MGRSCTMLRLGPRQVKVRKGLGTEGASPGMGTDRMANFTCIHAQILSAFQLHAMPRGVEFVPMVQID